MQSSPNATSLGSCSSPTILDPERAGDIEVWQTTWEPVWLSITKGILPRFDSALVAKAKVEAQEVYVDMGVRQDLGPLEVEA